MQADAIVGHHNLVMVFVTLQASNRDDAALAAGEGILESIGEQFVDEETDRHRDVDGSGSLVDLEVESNSADSVGVHDGRCDLTDVVSQVECEMGKHACQDRFSGRLRIRRSRVGGPLDWA